jgi:simple sugar transport system permease protein
MNRQSMLPSLQRMAIQSGDVGALLLILCVVILFFSSMSPRFLTMGTFTSVAFQLPELGLLTLAMLIPILSGGLNLAITFTANICGLTLAWILVSLGDPAAGPEVFALGLVAALAVGALVGWVMGVAVAYTGAHPILVSLAMMIFLRGVGEYLTRGGDVSGFPPFVARLGHGLLFGVPIPMWVFIACVVFWHILLNRTRFGFSVYMLGSNIEATRYSGINTRGTVTMIYTLSGLMCAIAGIVMVTRFNSVRIGHGEAYLLITVLACFLGRVDPFGGFGRTVPVVIALIILQIIASGLNLMGAHQHLATALWGTFLIIVMVVRSLIERGGPRRL